MSEVEIDSKKLRAIIRALSKNKYARVGVLGNPPRENPEEPTNVELAIKHEFGVLSERIPARSFLRMPTEVASADIAAVANSPTSINALLNGKPEVALARMGIKAEAVIQEAFDTRGFGGWAPNSRLTIMLKGSSSPLIDTGQLRRAVTSDVVG